MPTAPIARASAQLAAFAVLLVAPVGAQSSAPTPAAPSPVSSSRDGGTKKPLSIDDYSRWRTIESASISSDGKWVAYTLRHTNTLPQDSKPSVHIRNLGTNQDIEIANASSPVFSPDARWIAYSLDSVPARRGRGNAPADSTQNGRGGAPATSTPARIELRELATGRTQTWQDMTGATFTATSSHVLFRRRPPQGGGRGGAPGTPAPAPTGPRGGEMILHDLSTGRSQYLASVTEAAFNRKGDMLAYTVEAQARDGNGLFVINLATGRPDALDNDAKIYSRLTWTDDGNGLAVLKGKEVDKMRERDNVLMVVRDVRASLADVKIKPVVLDPAAASNFPKGFVVSDRAPISWSEDNARVFFGIIGQTPNDSVRRRSTDSVPDVDIWRTRDERIQSQQMIQAEQERNFTFREAYDVAASKYVSLSDSSMRDIQVSLDGKWAVGRDARPYISDYKAAAADIYRVNTATGERTLMMKGALTGQHVFGISPDGKLFLYWKDAKVQAFDLDAMTSRTLGGTNAPSFIDVDFDHPGPKPSFGVAGYTADGKSVIVSHKYDLWEVPLDGTNARNITNGMGTKGEIHFSLVRTQQPDELTGTRRARAPNVFDLSKPLTLAAYGEYTKKAGFYALENGQLREIMYDDAAFSNPVRAKNADTYLFTRQTFSEYPDLRVSGPNFRDAKKISDANPQQSEFLWGHRVLFDYKNKKGVRLQGILALPDDYKPGEKRPMIVSFYEKNSQNMHRYSAPSFVTGMGSLPMEAVTKGYITMFADVYFNTGSSHSDMLECVEAATKKVIELGYADPKRIGINGHSYGGEGAAFIATRSKMFAAVGVGAGVTDLFTDFSQSWGWSYQVSGGSGANGNEYYLYGQGRWGFSPWENPEVYHFESALTHANEVTAPVLIMHGTADPTVSFSEGMNFYNALRYNGKNAIMLAYPGEGHGLRALANRRDLTVRYMEFFDTYLKGAPAPKWMTDEQPFLRKNSR